MAGRVATVEGARLTMLLLLRVASGCVGVCVFECRARCMKHEVQA